MHASSTTCSIEDAKEPKISGVRARDNPISCSIKGQNSIFDLPNIWFNYLTNSLFLKENNFINSK